MGRVTYNEWDSQEAQWAGIRWAGAAKQAINSKRGQALLRELEAALLALPEPKLTSDFFSTPDGGVCALGALAKARGVDVSDVDDGDYDAPEIAKDRLGMTYTLAWEIMAQNDDGPCGIGTWGWTDEKRYDHVLAWVRRHLNDKERRAE